MTEGEGGTRGKRIEREERREVRGESRGKRIKGKGESGGEMIAISQVPVLSQSTFLRGKMIAKYPYYLSPLFLCHSCFSTS